MKTSDYRAVEIIPSDNCNCALSRLAGKLMLYSEIHELLTNPHSTCSCKFKHFDDRRHKVERRRFDVDNLEMKPHRRAQPYGRRAVDIHNRARDRFTKQRMEASSTALQ